MKKILFSLTVFLLLFACQEKKLQQPTAFVDPFIGTDAHGHTFPGATVPFGMVQLSPDTDTEGWDWCSGYHSSDKSIMGFSHKHLSGTGASDYGDILFMPTVGGIKFHPGPKDDPQLGYRSSFSHKQEASSPGYYKVHLRDYDIDVELTATVRTGFHRYTYPKSEQSNIIIDLESGIHDRPIRAYMKIVGDNEIHGYRESTGWAAHQRIYFAAKFSKTIESFGFQVDGKEAGKVSEVSGRNIVGYVSFKTEANEKVDVKVGISAVDLDGAMKNLVAESLDKNFEQVKQEADDLWNQYLSALEIEGTEEVKTKFYTALYHSVIAPNVFMDIDHRYRGMDGKIHRSEGFTNYTVFSLWDTFRATHPLFTILYPDRVNDMMHSFLKKYEQSGLLPVWELDANETNCMIGYNALPVIADAYIKGIRDYDVEKLYEAMKTSAMQNIRGSDVYRQYSFIPSDIEIESVSKTLEYAYGDWCIAMMAKAMGKTEDYDDYIRRAQFYQNVFDDQTKFMRPKQNGRFEPFFNPKAVSGDYTEANAWQYSFFVPQDLTNLIRIYGGSDSIDKKLDQMFNEKSDLAGNHQADITGLIGQYAHGNEPSHHMAYLYNYIGKPWKSQKILRQIMEELYTTGRDGICGNEDCGQMSSWYVLSSIGFYPVTPGTDVYVIGSPEVKNAKIKVPSGKIFEIDVLNQSGENIYIKDISLNGRKLQRSYITHAEILAGGKLVFTMANTPNKEWASERENCPETGILEKLTPNPYLKYEKLNFFDQLNVSIHNIDENAKILYSVNNRGYQEYKTPLTISENTIVSTFSTMVNSVNSDTVVVEFKKIPYRKSIEIASKMSGHYSGDGETTLIDYNTGSENLASGQWLGFEGQDFEAVVDIFETKEIHLISTNFIQHMEKWVFMPLDVTYSVSDDGENFTTVATLKHDIPMEKEGPVIRKFSQKFSNLRARYVKVHARNIKVCPPWHRGNGGPAWIFIDEIVVE
ncbi:MAG: GH92 family glycosyl hydrolase [Candidatus Marinimicrobia bacterium]|nr:GH92 family glycosyl hydrolase [Candidatus Neomarinimicrobiota bacterium]